MVSSAISLFVFFIDALCRASAEIHFCTTCTRLKFQKRACLHGRVQIKSSRSESTAWPCRYPRVSPDDSCFFEPAKGSAEADCDGGWKGAAVQG